METLIWELFQKGFTLYMNILEKTAILMTSTKYYGVNKDVIVNIILSNCMVCVGL